VQFDPFCYVLFEVRCLCWGQCFPLSDFGFCWCLFLGLGFLFGFGLLRLLAALDSVVVVVGSRHLLVWWFLVSLFVWGEICIL
jgi:hypothetical protein